MAGENVNGKATASLVCGIVSVVFMWMGWGALVAVATGVVGLVLGIGANKVQKDSKATAGIVLSIIGLVLGAIMFIGCTLCLGLLAAAGKEVQNGYNSGELQDSLNNITDSFDNLKNFLEK